MWLAQSQFQPDPTLYPVRQSDNQHQLLPAPQPYIHSHIPHPHPHSNQYHPHTFSCTTPSPHSTSTHPHTHHTLTLAPPTAVLAVPALVGSRQAASRQTGSWQTGSRQAQALFQVDAQDLGASPFCSSSCREGSNSLPLPWWVVEQSFLPAGKTHFVDTQHTEAYTRDSIFNTDAI